MVTNLLPKSWLTNELTNQLQNERNRDVLRTVLRKENVMPKKQKLLCASNGMLLISGFSKNMIKAGSMLA